MKLSPEARAFEQAKEERLQAEAREQEQETK